MKSRSVIFGASLGLMAAGLVLALLPSGPARHGDIARGELLCDAEGAFEQLVIQYRREAAAISAPVYRNFLPLLSSEVRVLVVCPAREDFEDLRRRVGWLFCSLEPLVTGHEMTTWSRDRWLALSQDGDGICLLTARGEDGQDAWPQRKGDGRIAFDIAQRLRAEGVTAARSELKFDGGDFVALPDRILVTRRVLAGNLALGIHSKREVLDLLEAHLGRRVVVLADAPDHHMGIYLMAAGEGRVVVADPSLGEGLIPAGVLEELMPGGLAEGSLVQKQLDAVADQLRAEGLDVFRMPVVAGRDGRTWMTPLNVVLENAGRSGSVVYMPVYEGADRLNEAGRRVWRSLGYEVREVDCTSAYRHFGSLRCLVNVLRRGG